MAEIQEVVDVWGAYFEGLADWEALIEGVEPRQTGCGPVYEVPNPIEGRPNESFAIADMRGLEMSEPHLHANGEYEIYFVLQGVGRTAVGNAIHDLEPDTYVVTRPDTVHVTIPGEGLVLAVVNTPPFKAENYVVVDEDEEVVAGMIAKLRAA
jgi:mannose-6-phosphate isomerase-like protein (cupin superfamily)